MKKYLSSMTMVSSVQWMFFIFANTVVVPLSIANAFELPPETMAMMIRASLIFTGVVCILQGWIGHRYPLMEGHSGLLWGVILNLGLSASALGMGLETIGGGIATGVLLACGVTLLLAAFGGISILQSIFNPMVMSVYLFLLTFQLMFIFFKGMLKITEQGTIDIWVSLFSVCLAILVAFLKLKGNQMISNFSILIGLLGGWAVYALLFGNEAGGIAQSAPFTLFPLGMPNLEFGIVAVAFVAVLLNLSNTFASLTAADKLLKRKAEKKDYRSSMFITALFTIIGTGFGLVPYTPFTSTIGFLQSTRIYDRKPFFIGGGLLTIIGLIPVLGAFLSMMPVTVGNAVLFIAYMQLFGTAFSSLNGKEFNSNTIFRLAAPVLIGISIMNVSPVVFSELPILLQPFISNGLIMGMIISIILEKVVDWSAYEQQPMKHGKVS
ncbi:uracil/xanthine transporter [Cytobacillus purgationiresistens]|uniref:Xanthine/uracil permease n=1 Tax=Cytobacillus purgationiresistens TaxID=863449 RepID=A0ABU0ANL0_9BACI|nr:uracil/xanthine transporter [Cytobacillus purgationiresistens]MDQ0272878.1 xanthine/uracil permease [Cytobacillus purgationiresistens]